MAENGRSTKTWRCRDCGAEYPMTVPRCSRPFDDYLALRGGSVESAIHRAVELGIAPLVARAEARLQSRIVWVKGGTRIGHDREFAIGA